MPRNAAINNLRGFGTFRYASLRLLDDLVELMGEDRPAPEQVETYIDRAKENSFSLFWSLDLRYWKDLDHRADPRVHLICLCAAAGQSAPLEALGHLLAYSIARQFDEAAAVVSFDNDRQMHIWYPGGFIGPLPVPEKTDESSMAEEIAKLLPNQPFCHLIYVYARPSEAANKRERFHRIIYVNPEPEIAAVPAHLSGLLIESLWKGAKPRIAPLFSSFVSTHFLGDARTGAAIDDAPFGARIGGLTGWSGLRTQPTGDVPGSTPRPACWRLRRDACRLAMDLTKIGGAWHEWSTAPGNRKAAFAEALFQQAPGYRDSAFHWARAVTNRQVGLALSGGGASSYRMVPFIRRLRNELAVPIDVVGGVSGGALLGAYYCAQGLAGIDSFIAQGPLFSAFALGAIVSSRVISTKIDYDLLAARIERLETRFAPVTTVLTRGRAPEQHVVIGGSVGDGVRVSGSAPVLWGQTIMRRLHYSDGGSAMLIPARSLREHGADMVIACNCVPGPAEGNPISYYVSSLGLAPAWLAEKLSEYTLCGRLADGLVAAAFLNQQASREMEEDAHMYVEPNPSPLPMLESFAFYDAPRLVAAAEREMRQTIGNRREGTAAAASIWARFRQSPMRS